uniref:Integrin alpha-8-like n=1 Tax=Callorhinchus milii TaxID=7868 RepID=A0A4W3ID31_CALMI
MFLEMFSPKTVRVASIPCLYYFLGILPFSHFLFLQIHAFNLDADKPVIYSGPERSYFGFSIDFYLPGNGTPYLVVGAPKAQTEQVNVTEGGAVFLCPWAVGGSPCVLIPFDTEGNRNLNLALESMKDYKSNQWFGATVKADKDKLLACAPLYHWKYVTRYMVEKTSGLTPVGTCLIALQNFSSYAEYSPCRSTTVVINESKPIPSDRRYCEAGWSSEITKDGDIVLGAPVCYFGQGLIATTNIEQIVQTDQRKSPEAIISQQRQSTDAKGSKDNSYEGYSMALGEFSGDSIEEFLVGAPGQNDTKGSVIIMNSTNIKAIHNIIGEQVASYFGSAVAVLDINNDGRDDIVVGAPLYIIHSPDGQLHEVGRVYIYLQDQPGQFRQPQKLTGTYRFGRYGNALGNLGDLNRDGFNDVAVGAPFAGEDGNGRVYIYTGHASGLDQKPRQELMGPWASDSGSARFGFSLRGGSDIDANEYPDLIVGGYGVNKVAVYRARPVIRANAKLILNPDILNPQEKTCYLSQLGASVSCFIVQACITIEGHGIPQNMNLTAEIQLDINKQRSQQRTLFLHSSQTKQVFLFQPRNQRTPTCINFTAYLKNETELKDKLSLIVVTLNCSLQEMPMLSSDILTPVLSPDKYVLITKKARILLNCGPDNICIPALSLAANINKRRLFIGDTNPLTLIFTASNDGEGAFEAELHLPIPANADFIDVVRNNKSLSKLRCNLEMENEVRTVVCDLGNPMRNGTKISAGLQFTMHSLDQVENVTFITQIKSKNSEGSRSNAVHLNLMVASAAQVILRGVSLPEEVVLQFTDESLENPEMQNNTLPVMEHVYEEEAPSTKSPSTANIVRIRDNHKRDVSESEFPLEEETSFSMNCTRVRCTTIRCHIGLVEKGKGAVVNIQSRLQMEIFIKKTYKQFTFLSNANFMVKKMPYKVLPESPSTGTAMVNTVIVRRPPETSSPTPNWVIYVSVLGGLVLVALMTILMWKCGFFERKRPPTEDDE